MTVPFGSCDSLASRAARESRSYWPWRHAAVAEHLLAHAAVALTNREKIVSVSSWRTASTFRTTWRAPSWRRSRSSGSIRGRSRKSSAPPAMWMRDHSYLQGRPPRRGGRSSSAGWRPAQARNRVHRSNQRSMRREARISFRRPTVRSSPPSCAALPHIACAAITARGTLRGDRSASRPTHAWLRPRWQPDGRPSWVAR